MSSEGKPTAEAIKVEKTILALVLLCSSIVFAVAFMAAYFTGTMFMVKLFSAEVVIAAVAVLFIMRRS